MKKSTADGISFFVVMLILIPPGLYFDFTRTITLWIIGLFGLLLLIMYFSFNSTANTLEAVETEKRKNLSIIRTKARVKSKSLIKAHIETLARRRLALVRVDHYGIMNKDSWYKEIQHFADKIIFPELTPDEAKSLEGDGKYATTMQELIDDSVRLRSEEIGERLSYSSPITPQEFEKICANQLEKQGWKCITTKLTGDQGADVVAERKIGKSKSIRIILQCKLWESAVGNKAVQEAHAAKAHYIADHAVVVTNSEFTASARQLAQSTNVYLWHFSDLERIDQLLKN
jgi:restriction system protein